MTDETTEEIEPSPKTLEQPTLRDVIKAIDGIAKRLDAHDIQFEAIRQGIAQNSAAFDRLEALALEAKSIALITRSQMTILTEEMRQRRVEAVV